MTGPQPPVPAGDADDHPTRPGLPRFGDAVADMMRQMDEGLRSRLDDEAALGLGELGRRTAADQGRTRSFRTHAPGANQHARVGQFDWTEFDAEQAAATLPPDPEPDLDVATRPHYDVIDTTAHEPDPPPAGALPA